MTALIILLGFLFGAILQYAKLNRYNVISGMAGGCTSGHILLIGLFAITVLTQCGKPTPVVSKSISMGIVIYSNDVETVWNALRFANFSKTQGDSVSIFLLGKGVELENLVKSDSTIKEQSDKFLKNGGTILGCGTCLKSRNNNDPQVCKFSSLKDLYNIARKNKIVMTF